MGSLSRSVPPQVGMLHFDKEWREELTMLRLAVHHVNALRPRFVVISGDLINAFPKEEAAQVVRLWAFGNEPVRQRVRDVVGAGWIDGSDIFVA